MDSISMVIIFVNDPKLSGTAMQWVAKSYVIKIPEEWRIKK